MIQSAAQPLPPTRRSALPGEGMLVAIAPQVDNYKMLAAGVLPGAKVLILDGDAIGQITHILDGDASINSLHIICHGAPGVLELGTTRLGGENVGRYRHELRRWGVAEILLYACNVVPPTPQNWGEPVSSIASPRPELGEGPGVRAEFSSPRPELGEGPGVRADLLSRLHELTGANIAAASGWVGSAKKGGSWNLDRAIGRVRKTVPFVDSIQQNYRGILATFTVTTTDDIITGSLRDAIDSANSTPGTDTIIFNIPLTDPGFDPITGSYTIQPLSALPEITDPVIIDGTSQPGFTNSPIIEIDGSSADDDADDDADGLTIGAASSTIKGLVVNRFSGSGILLQSDGNTIQQNYIGTDTTGAIALGNGLGIFLQGNQNLIGGSGVGNTIAFNNTDGIFVFAGTGNAILNNSIFQNEDDLGIDLGSDGLTPNDDGDADTGPNNLQNYPILNAAIPGTAGITIVGTLNSTPNAAFTVQFFSNQELDPSGFGEGETFLGQTTVTTDAAGNVTFSETLPVVLTGTEFITATATDPNNNTSEFSAGIVANAPPTANDDTATTSANIPIIFNITDNDRDTDGNIDVTTVDLDPATEETQSTFTTAEGEFSVDETGNVTFIPNAGFVGNSAIAYTVRDNLGALSNVATITVNVENTPPTANDDTTLTLAGLSASIDVLANDSDPDGDNLTVIATTPGNFGTTAIADNNRVVYTPNAGFRGNDSFTYTISDPNGGTDTARVNLSVRNSNPIAFNNSTTTPSNIPINIDVLGNDYDADGDILSLDNFTSGENGEVTRDDNGTPEILTDDSLIYTPNSGFNGSDTFTYTVDDGNGGTDRGTVTVEVTNATPIANDDTAETSNNAAVAIDILANDSDPDGDTLNITNVTSGDNGSVEINENNTVTYTPNRGFLGTDTFSYTVDDGNENTATANVTVEVTNSPPVANDDTAETRHNPAFTITPQDLATVTVDVLANDSDPDGDILSITSVTPGDNGSVEINENNTVTYTPNYDFLGTDTFTYTVDDGNENTATATVTVEVINSPPIANDDFIEVLSGISTEMRFLLNDRDPDGDVLVVISATEPMNGELDLQLEDVTIFYTSDPGFIGTDSFTYTISDRLGGTDTATITINVVNFPPIIDLDESADGVNFNTVFNVGGEAIAIANNTQITDLDDTTLASLTVNFTPIDGEFETLSLTNIPPEITATPTPNGWNLTGTASLEAYQTAIDGIVYNNTAEIPTPGDRIITVTASDGKTTGELATSTIRINNPPIIPANLNAITRADTPVGIDILTEAIDPDGDAIAISNFTNGENGTVTLSENGLIYTPNPGFGGFDTFTYTVADSNGATASATVTVGVSNIVVTPPTPPVTTESSGSAVDVALSIPPTADVRVSIASSDPTEAIVVPGILIFTPENFSTPQAVIVAGMSDSKIDGDSAFNLIISPAESTDPNYAAIDAPDLAFTKIDTTSIIEFSTPTFAVSEENPTLTLTRNNTAGVVGASLILSGGTATPNSDYNPISLNVLFDEGENSKVVNLPIIDDPKIEAAETVDISLVTPRGNAVLGSRTAANVVINPSDGGPLNLNIQNLRSITSTNPQLPDRGVEFSNNALGIEDFNLNGNGNFIDELKFGQSDAITYDRGDSLNIEVPEGFVNEISFRYASPFRSHQVVIRDVEGNELASRTLTRTEDSGLTPGAYVLGDRITTIEFEGVATSVELGSQANKLLIADLILGSPNNNLSNLGFVDAIADPFNPLF